MTSQAAEARAIELKYPPLQEPLEIGTYDNHTHLEIGFGEAGLNLADQLTLMSASGMKGAVQVGVTLESSKWCAAVAAVEPQLLAAVALHPNEAPLYKTKAALDQALAEIAELAKQPRVRAIGETGLDFFRTTEVQDLELQQYSFEEHIRIAKENNLALMIHDRDAHDEVVKTLHRVGAPEKVVFHCYSGDLELAMICADNGWHMSFAGNITIKRNQHLRDSLNYGPKELILIETDAPFLSPEPFRGRPNAPYLVPVTLRFMAEQRGVSVNEMAEQINLNTERVYGSWSIGLVEKPEGWQPPPAPRDSSEVD
ncbi:MAG: TatD family hydrolase [Micrococcales bacterium]